jgi:hypothetical protein
VPWAVLFAAVGVAVWLIADPRTPDLAAQVYRVSLFRHVGFAVWDEHWYAGHLLPGYSLLFAPLAALLGLRVVAALSVLASAALFERLALDLYGEGARRAAVWFALAALADIWIGRLAFALGVSLALGAALACLRARPALAVALAALCAASSPVAGLLLALAALTHTLIGRSPRAALLLAAPAVALAAALAALFGEGGWEPYPTTSFLATAAVVLVFLWALPPGRELRIAALVYLAACLASLAVHSPMGANIERYGVLLAGPLLLCAVGRERLTAPALAALCAIAVWTAWGPLRETAAVAGDPATAAAYYVPLERYLAAHGGALARVEVPFTRSHWEAAWLAPRFSLARGWEKQLDTRYDDVLLAPGLTAKRYHAWLREQAVRYVALPDAPLDRSSAQEGRLIDAGLPYLREVFSSRHWRVYEVRDALALAQGPGRLSALGHDFLALLARAPGTFTVRVRYTRYMTLTRGAGCVAPAPGGWTSVSARAAGPLVVAARFSLGRALGLDGGSCRGGGVGALAAGARIAAADAAAGGADGGADGLSSAEGLGQGSASSPGSTVAQQTATYRWLVPVTGAPPSIAAENAAYGTTAWRLPGPPGLLGGEGHGAVAGYVAEQALAPGQTERVYVDAPGARTVTVQVFRMGWYGGRGGRLVLASGPLPVASQPPCTHRSATGLTECTWRATLSFPIPNALPSGVYIVKLSTRAGAQRDCLFVVRAAHPRGLLVAIPTATYEAYNAWGGDSLYPGGSLRVGATGTTQGVEVSYDRPYDSQTGAGQFFIREVAVVRFLERYGYPVSYTTSESLDGDPAQALGAKALIDAGHSEYWSQRAADALRTARDAGTSLIFLSSDTLAWRVRFAAADGASSEAGRPDHTIVAYKQFAGADPDRADPSGLFPGGGAQLAGSAYDGCISPRVAQAGPPVYRYYAWTPVASLRPAWLFAGTGITAVTRIPGIVGYELDERTPATPPGTQLLGSGAGVPCQPETEPSPVRGTVAQTTLYTARSGALVFATGTLGWEYALSPVPQASPDAPLAPDPRVVRMTRNVLARVLSGVG